MIKIQTASLREFQRRANQIPANSFLPILSNLKIELAETCIITKNSINSVCMGLVIAEGEPQRLLVPERILYAALSVTTDEWITIDAGVIKFGGDIIQFTEDDINVFPMCPEITDQPTFLLTQDHIKPIVIAGAYVNSNKNAGLFSLVHMAGDSIFAFNPSYFYINNSFNGLPPTWFGADEVAVISTYDTVEFLNLKNHHVFFSTGYTYIFIKEEASTPNIESVLDRLRLLGKSFTCNKTELLNFINLANTVSESEIATCTIIQEGLFAKLLMNDTNYGRSNERVIIITGELDEFTFNGRVVINAFRSISHEILNAKTNQHCLIIQQDKEWFCFMGTVKN